MIRFFFLLSCSTLLLFSKPLYRSDDASSLAINKRVSGSHINVFIPNMPYIYLAKLINGTLLRSTDNNQGWEYMLAKDLKRDGNLIYTFTLRKNIKFQDGTLFDANDIVENFQFAMQEKNNNPMLYDHIKSVKKLSKYRVQFILNKPLERFLYFLTRYNIYSKKYLKKFSWGAYNTYTSDNMKEPGPYGLGPYILKKGYSIGRKQTAIIELKANPYYYEKGMPYIENITIYTELSTKEVLSKAFKKEELDITPIPFNKKVETITSSFTKLVTVPSRHSIAILMNMMRKDSILKNIKIRLALNEAIDQEKLLKFVYKGEGQIAPTTSNTNLYSVKLATQNLQTHHKKLWNKENTPKNYLKNILNNLELNVVTMDQMMFLWKGIEFQLAQYGVKINYTIIKSEIELFEYLLTNRDTPQQWDLLSWSNDSWSSNNPWSVFFHYHLTQPWSAISKDDVLQTYLNTYLVSRFNSPEHLKITKKIIHHVYNKAYMLAVPSPNIVLAVNKEVDYVPSAVLLMPLWKTRLTPYHWSIRAGKYPKKRQLPIRPEKSKQ